MLAGKAFLPCTPRQGTGQGSLVKDANGEEDGVGGQKDGTFLLGSG